VSSPKNRKTVILSWVMGDAFFEPKIQDLRSVKKEKERVLADNMSKIAEKVKKLDSINKMQTTRQA